MIMVWVTVFGLWTIIMAILLGIEIGASRAKHEHLEFWDIVGVLLCVLMIIFSYVLSFASMTLCPSNNMEYPVAEYRFEEKLLKTEVDGVVTNVDTVYLIRKKQQK